MELTTSKTIANQTNDKAAELYRLYQQLFSDRSMFETQWQEVSELVSPDQSRSFQGQLVNKGEKRNTKQYDSTAQIALGRFMAILDSLLTPVGQTWHSLRTDDPILNRDRATADYLDKTNRLLFRERYKPHANFVEANQQVWSSIGAYGTGFQFIDQIWGMKGFRYKFVPLSNMYVAENHQGQFNKFFRKYRMTARQALQVFPDTLPHLIIETAKTNPETRFEFLHIVEEREDYDPGRKDFRGMKWAAYDISITGVAMLKEGGYRTKPYAGTRYDLSLEEVYGRSPAMTVLPTIKTLNEVKKTLLKQGHRAVDPIYLVHDDGVLSNMNVRPGAMVAGGVDAQGRPLVHALQTGNVQIGKELLDDDRADVKSVFMTDLFQILMETPEMTATEVMERIKEKGILISPAISRQEQYLGDVINREMDLAVQQRLLEPMPRMLREANGEYNVRFESPLAKMRRAEEAAGFMRSVEQALQIVQATQDPSVMYFFNFDKAIPEMADIAGVKPSWINTLDKVNQLRQAQAQEKAQQNAIAAGPAAAAVLKALPQNAGGGGV